MVIAIIALLTAILVPSLSSARIYANRSRCLSNLHNLGIAAASYHSENGEFFWPFATYRPPANPIYFWGSLDASGKLDTTVSPFMKHNGFNTGNLLCPAFPWGSYIPQAGATEPTTTYAYNAWCLDPALWSRKDASGAKMTIRKVGTLQAPDRLFVFVDSCLRWSPGGVTVLQNSSSLDPVHGAWVQQPTTHFRHRELTNALLADGHAASFDTEGGGMIMPKEKIGFVGTANVPHYDDQ